MIPSFEFNGCTQLTEIKLPSTVNKVSDRAFASCSGLAEINLPDTVTEIGAYAFSSCSKLAGINAVKDGTDSILDTLPSSLTQIGTNAFDGCSALRKLSFQAMMVRSCRMRHHCLQIAALWKR